VIDSGWLMFPLPLRLPALPLLVRIELDGQDSSLARLGCLRCVENLGGFHGVDHYQHYQLAALWDY